MAKKKMEPKATWLILLLWSIQSAGSLINPAEIPPQYQINRTMGGSVLLHVNIPSEETVERIEWDFKLETGLELWFAEFKGRKLERPHPRDRFGQRLEMVNETTLGIKDLQVEDSGAYRARVNFATKHFHDQTFLLTVYEPVPELKILPRNVSNTPYGCNVTLQCQVSRKGEFNISWKRGNPLRDVEVGSDWFQISNNGKDLHLSWWLNSSEPNFTCLATNPADQKNISFNVLNICQTRGENIPLSWVSPRVVIILLGLLVQITIVTLVSILGRKE